MSDNTIAHDIANKAIAKYPHLLNNVSVPLDIHTQFWEIVCAFCDTDTTCEGFGGDLECLFCNGGLDYSALAEGFIHEASCIVLKARELIRQVQE